MLTGDKIETAINIGFSAGLLDSDMDQNLVHETDHVKLAQELAKSQTSINVNSFMSQEERKKQAVIVAGASLVEIASDTKLRNLFLEITDNVDVVLACRVSPKQKADIVNLVRTKHPEKTTLAIGDGANDVSMILAAHVGIGILGKEGQQAARSADYAIGQFKFLKPLLFFHGREAYRRNSYFILYNFYKNFLYVVTQFYFGFYSAFSGQTLYDQVIYQLYNMTMTSAPIMYFATYDYQYEKDPETLAEKTGNKPNDAEYSIQAVNQTKIDMHEEE